MAGNMIINNKGNKTVHIRITGNDKNWFIVVLTCSADGSKYPPIYIFKGKQLPRGKVIPKGVICWFQENGWMTSDLMKKYIEFLLRLRMAENLSKEPAIMMYDFFQSHLEESVKDKFKQHDFHLAVIPAGLTSNGASKTEAGNLKRVKISDICGWVKYESKDDMVYEEIDKLITEFEDKNLDELDDSTKIVDN
ncbi:hypothetical protein RhiirC2_778490 [Rhizophagus irregularis]|uniref:DDE-1 domain-containing protein n=1 Tax=Rhizophagus irregularis TaxID=588596 RepID=A0A2N1NBU4_9GLOM|nr:hypothetical protein RhiirC2_778490 [Rhizophagus irregularis]